LPSSLKLSYSIEKGAPVFFSLLLRIDNNDCYKQDAKLMKELETFRFQVLICINKFTMNNFSKKISSLPHSMAGFF
jgi:hypothetical protein